MSIEQKTSLLLKSLYSQDDFHSFLSSLRQFLEEYFFTSNSPDQKISEAFDTFLKQKKVAAAEFPQEFFNDISRENMYNTVEQMGKIVETLPIADVTLAIPVSVKTTAYIGKWLRENIGEQTLVDLRYDPSLIAGCQITWKSRTLDASLATQIEKTEAITQTIKDHYGHE